MSEPILAVTQTDWSVQEVFDGHDEEITFDTEENALLFWRENQPSILKRTVIEHYVTPEKKAEFDELQASKTD